MSESSYTEYVCDVCGATVKVPYAEDEERRYWVDKGSPTLGWSVWGRKYFAECSGVFETIVMCPKCERRVRSAFVLEVERIKGG